MDRLHPLIRCAPDEHISGSFCPSGRYAKGLSNYHMVTYSIILFGSCMRYLDCDTSLVARGFLSKTAHTDSLLFVLKEIGLAEI